MGFPNSTVRSSNHLKSQSFDLMDPCVNNILDCPLKISYYDIVSEIK